MNFNKTVKFFVILLSIGYGTITWSQTAPSNLNGPALRDWIKTNHYDGQHTSLTYSTARMYMYNYIDNKNNRITGVYSGYQKTWTYGGSGTNPSPINCEHTIPQSFFSSAYPMKSDIHHLFPTYQNWNSVRSNYRLGEIPDDQTTNWMIDDVSQANIPATNIDAYSEGGDLVFEPRESHKGNAARAIFYFYTMYPTQAGDISQVADIDELYEWHLADPVDAAELDRNTAAAIYQGNRNPYIDAPELVARAWEFDIPTDPGPDPDPGTATTDLIISEYVEGSSNNKAIEIANFTGATIDLSAYELGKQTNGSGGWTKDLPLSGQLLDGETFVVAHASASQSLRNRADMTSPDWTISFNGNDPVALFKNGALIDIVGVFNGGSADFAKNATLVRKAAVTNPTTVYDENEWEVFASNTIIYLGAHEMDVVVEPTAGTDLVFSEYVEGSSYNKALEIGNITNTTIDLGDYAVKKQTNGAGSWSGGIPLSGSLTAGEVYVLANASAAGELLAQADYIGNSTELSFNGNDALGLFKNGVLLDVIGNFNGGSANFAKDVTLVRNSDILSPNENYTIDEWTAYPSNTFAGIGSLNTIYARLAKEKETEPLGFLVYPNPLVGQATIEFNLAKEAVVRLNLYDNTGKAVKQITETRLLPGQHRLSFDGADLAAGMYFISLEMEGSRQLTKLVKTAF